MNINAYLPDELAEQLDRLADMRGQSRSAVMREALEAYLRRHRAGGWPAEILDWKGDPSAQPFESGRPPPHADSRDPFAEGAE